MYIRGSSAFIVSMLLLIGGTKANILIPNLLLLSGFLGISIGALTYFYPHMGILAKENETIAGMFSESFNKALKRKSESMKLMKQIAAKEATETSKALNELKNTKKDFNVKDLPMEQRHLAEMTPNEVELFFKEKGIIISDKIKNMGKEEIEKEWIKAKGGRFGMNYDKFPWKYLQRASPQWILLNNKTNINSDSNHIINNDEINIQNENQDNDDDEIEVLA